MDKLTADILTGLGLAITLAGAWITARAVILKESDAINVGTTRIMSDNLFDRRSNPMVQTFLASSRGRGAAYCSLRAELRCKSCPLPFGWFRWHLHKENPRNLAATGVRSLPQWPCGRSLEGGCGDARPASCDTGKVASRINSCRMRRSIWSRGTASLMPR